MQITLTVNCCIIAHVEGEFLYVAYNLMNISLLKCHSLSLYSVRLRIAAYRLLLWLYAQAAVNGRFVGA